MRLYHMTSDIRNFEENRNNDGSYTFTPRIPANRLDTEENDTPRVCVSKTIEGCLEALPIPNKENGEKGDFEEKFEVSNGVFVLLEIDTQALNISKKNIIDLVEDKMLHKCVDAYFTEEVWITQVFTVPFNKIRYISFNDVETEKVFYSDTKVFNLIKKEKDFLVADEIYSKYRFDYIELIEYLGRSNKQKGSTFIFKPYKTIVHQKDILKKVLGDNFHKLDDETFEYTGSFKGYQKALRRLALANFK